MIAATLNSEPPPQSEETLQQEPLEHQSSSRGLDALPLVDQLFIDENVPEEIIESIVSYLLPEESIFVLFQLNSSYSFTTDPDHTEKAPFWTVITGTRLLLLAVSSEGKTYCDTFDQHTLVEYQNGLTRDEIRIADKTITTAIWEGKRKLFQEAVQLFPLPEYEKYLYFANIYLDKENYAQAIPFFERSLELEPSIKGYLLLVQTLSRAGSPDKAIDMLGHACHFAEPASVLQEIQVLFPDNLVLFLYLAVVFEKNHWWDMGIQIYQTLLEKTPDFDLYFLKLAELYRLKEDFQSAIEYYQKFIKLRTESEKFENGGFIAWDLSDVKCFAADPDLAKAYFDLGIIYERDPNNLGEALTMHLSLLRHAPFYVDAYQHFWQVYQRLLEQQPSRISDIFLHFPTFLQIYQFLTPKEYASRPYREFSKPPSGSPIAYHPLRETDYELLTHPGEREYWRRIQSWVTSLVISEEEDHGIEQYCEQVTESNYPTVARIIARLSAFLEIEPPRCFISRGKIGVSVKNKEQPFIFIGSEHLNEENERYFSEAELIFVIAAQLEHIKSGHLLITDTELWKSLGSASFDGFLVALQCLPAGGFLGRITHRFATEGLKKVYQMTKYSSVQKILRFLDKRVDERNSDEFDDESEEGTSEQRNGRSLSKKPSEAESALKEQLVDFARHAVYTADRVGLLACHDMSAACSAIFKVAGDTYDDLKNVFQEGLLQILTRQDKRGKYLYSEYANRFSELIKFALSEEYQRIHDHSVIMSDLPEEQRKNETQEIHVPLLDKLSLLEQSRHNELLTPDEFFLKQQHLLENSGLLSEEDRILVEKFQQASRDGVLTYKELQTKLIQLLQNKVKG